ncbi:MAG TPA: phosphatase PAP2 family protein [Streptosporangiaceae bacterium]|jgi:undecaprenyl-diphosphatase|nr:phosphatase PAP2 family protein [Streptosporangiaceae bacterium]
MAWGRWRQVSRAPHALITPHARLPLTAVVLLCVAVVIALGVHYAGHTAAGPLDASVDHWVQGRLGLTSVPLTVLTWLGDQAEVTLITIAATLGCLLARWWRGAVLALLAAPVSALLTEDILKPVIGRTIGGAVFAPNGQLVSVAALSMPSGHTTAVFTLATLAAVLLIRPGGRLRYLIVAAAYLLATAVAMAMIAQNFHYFTDVISGAAVGTGTVLTGALAIDALAAPVWARVRRAAGTHPRTSPGPN